MNTVAFTPPPASASPSPPRDASSARRRLVIAAAAATAVCAALPTSVLAQRNVPAEASSRYRRVPKTADGIGKAYMDREIAGVMGWQGAAWLERDERGKEERGDLLLRELQLKPGMNVADVGAGTGYHSRGMARRVAPGGTVYAVDVQPEMIRLLTRLSKDAGLANVEPVLGGEQDVKLAPASIDLAVMVDVYHELAYPYEVVESIVRALKPGGRIAYVEYRAEDASVPIKPVHKMSLAQIRREAAAHALVFDRLSEALPWQHLVIFRKA